MNFLFFLLIMLPAILIILPMLLGKKITMINIATALIGIGITISIGNIVIQNIGQAVMADPNAQNNPAIQSFFGSFLINDGQSPPQQPIQQPAPQETNMPFITQEISSNIENKSIYLNNTKFNDEYIKWKNG